MDRSIKSWSLFEILIAVGLCLLLLLLSPILIPLIVYTYLRDKITETRFKRLLKKNEGAKFFCYTSRQSSVKFARENILPYLDDDITVIYMSEKGELNLGDDDLFHTIIGERAGGGKKGGYPFVAKIIEGELISHSLNREFYRRIVRDDDATQLLVTNKEFFNSFNS